LNFHKYLVDRSGKVVASFGSRTKPDDAELVKALEKLLAEPSPGP
jgi:glutathione peroxidase